MPVAAVATVTGMAAQGHEQYAQEVGNELFVLIRSDTHEYAVSIFVFDGVIAYLEQRREFLVAAFNALLLRPQLKASGKCNGYGQGSFHVDKDNDESSKHKTGHCG